MSQISSSTHRLALIMAIVMGVLILAGFTFLAFEIASRAGDVAAELIVSNTDETAADSATSATGPVATQLPDGAAVQAIAADAGRLVIWYRLGDRQDQIMVVDLRTGAPVIEIGASSTAPAGSL
ncbi:MAG: hypothetical protein AAF213_07865 [Pseudomonadota bacterium]